MFSKNNYTHFISFTCIALQAFWTSSAKDNETTDRPNVLMIAIDDLNDWLGYTGVNPDVKTPNIDRLAHSGVAFSRVYSQYPLCGPSRASVFSGELPPRLGYLTHAKDEEVQKQVEEAGSELLHEAFRRQGYKTMAVGKLMHSHVPEGSVDLSGGRGGWGMLPNKKRLNFSSDATMTDWGPYPDNKDFDADIEAADWAVKRIGEQHEQPFLLMVGFMRPHVPWYVAQKWFDLYPNPESLWTPPYDSADLIDVPAISRETNVFPGMPTTEWAIENKQWPKIVQSYLACISFVDAQVGAVLDALEASPYAENTIVILWSDHGYHIGEKGTFQKHSLWERANHVPLIIKLPHGPKNQSREQVASLLDIYPTMVELAGLESNPQLDGSSLVPYLNNPDLKRYRPALTYYKDFENFSVQTDRYRYYHYKNESEELYDHGADPYEMKNLANNPVFRPLMDSYIAYERTTRN